MNEEQERIFDEAVRWARRFGFWEGILYGVLFFLPLGLVIGYVVAKTGVLK